MKIYNLLTISFFGTFLFACEKGGKSISRDEVASWYSHPQDDFVTHFEKSRMREGDVILSVDEFDAGEKREFAINSSAPMSIRFTAEKGIEIDNEGEFVALTSTNLPENSFRASIGGGNTIAPKDGIIRFSIENQSSFLQGSLFITGHRNNTSEQGDRVNGAARRHSSFR